MKPLYNNDAQPMIPLSKFQKKSIKNLLNDIKKGKLNLVDNHCLCLNQTPENDIVIAEKDRYAIPVKNVLCSKCGLIRSKKIFDEKSNLEFYKNYYRNIYTGLNKPNDNIFLNEKARGKQFLSLVKKHVNLNEIEKLLEVGCGSGGIIKPFDDIGISCVGVDYEENYLEFGRNKGLMLLCGDYKKQIKNESIDLLILSHVMEHFTKPIEEIVEIIKKVKADKYLLIEVPGIFYMDKPYLNPIFYLQNAHIFNYYYADYLKIFYTSLGLEVLYGDERCTFLLKKKTNWEIPKIGYVYNSSLAIYPKKIRKFILKTYFIYKNFKKYKYSVMAIFLWELIQFLYSKFN